MNINTKISILLLTTIAVLVLFAIRYQFQLKSPYTEYPYLSELNEDGIYRIKRLTTKTILPIQQGQMDNSLLENGPYLDKDHSSFWFKTEVNPDNSTAPIQSTNVATKWVKVDRVGNPIQTILSDSIPPLGGVFLKNIIKDKVENDETSRLHIEYFHQKDFNWNKYNPFTLETPVKKEFNYIDGVAYFHLEMGDHQIHFKLDSSPKESNKHVELELYDLSKICNKREMTVIAVKSTLATKDNGLYLIYKN